jgi:hypothetical protein
MRRFPAVMLLAAALALPAAWADDSQQPPAKQPPPAKSVKKAAAENPRDWSGVWELDWEHSGLGGGGRGANQPKLTPEYQAKLDAYRAAQKKGENQQTQTANCVPPGMPQIMTQPYPVEFLFTPGKVTVAIEAYSQMRRIFMDGRKHPDDPDPTFQGHSIGHWEGDTLVVDSVGFVTNTMITTGVFHSDQMHIVEHIRKVAPDSMTIETTIIDPKALQEPWTVARAYKRHTDWDIKEYICDENNRDSADEEGHAGLNISR